MKITVISYDFWNYDAHITDALQKLGVDAHHINLSKVGHKNLVARAGNTLSKAFLKKNRKEQNRKKFLLESLEKRGKQDQILVINPEMFAEEIHQKIREYTPRYITYLYDSVARCPVQHLLSYFDKVFSFDTADAENFGFKNITNYNYLPEETGTQNPEYDLVYLASFDPRHLAAQKIYDWAKQNQLKFYARIIGKKGWKMRLKNTANFAYTSKRIHHNQIPDFYRNGKAILDLVRNNQTGLSFRIFEAMALKKKIVTDNGTVKNYDFYNPENIVVLGKDELKKEFFETPYSELPAEIYKKYTVEYWVETVFGLDRK